MPQTQTHLTARHPERGVFRAEGCPGRCGCRPGTRTAGPESAQGPRGPQSCQAKKAEWGIQAEADPWRSWAQGVCHLGEQCWVPSKAFQGPFPSSPQRPGFGSPPVPPASGCTGPPPTAPTPSAALTTAASMSPGPSSTRRLPGRVHPAPFPGVVPPRGTGRATPRGRAVDVCPTEGEAAWLGAGRQHLQMRGPRSAPC